MRIRPAVVEDAAALARVYVDSWRDAYAGLLPDMVLVGMSDVRQAAAWARELQHESAGATLVAEDESGVFGLSTVGPARAASKAFLEGGEIYRLYVEPGRQNEGAGRALMEASFAWMARCGDDA
ncbi:MAG: GNAT family N-acetyltransferase, partial [Rhodospirillales bacterium]|nr:GNAT family N-acetyltransferase [Rhodospirillales bacterium]